MGAAGTRLSLRPLIFEGRNFTHNPGAIRAAGEWKCIQLSSPGSTGRPSIPETPVIEPRSRSVLDTPLEPVIGLAKGETRWRGMTVGLKPPRHCEERELRVAGE
jgi:hypothetical protein